MSMSDPIADFLTIIRNGCKGNFKYVDTPASKIKRQIAKILHNQGFIKRFILIDDGRQGLLRVWLKYDTDGKPIINTIRRGSKPGRRLYVNMSRLPRVMNNLGVAILTTPKGVMTAREALRNKVGGEILCYIW
jgi:small subunit ribosomal protein S8